MIDRKHTPNAVKEEYSKDIAIEEYEGYTRTIGLWASEKALFEKYVPQTARILDIGCGAGRTTIALYEQEWKNILGTDLSDRMIDSARKLSAETGISIPFEPADATMLRYADNEFEIAFFSFNGLMTIPDRKNRLTAVREIARVLRPGGIFLFTTHDRDLTPESFRPFWEEEKKRWETNTQDPRLIDFGDRIVMDKGREIFIHIPDQKEVREIITSAEFDLLETAMRSDLANESDAVKEYSSDCRVWVARKPFSENRGKNPFNRLPQ